MKTAVQWALQLRWFGSFLWLSSCSVHQHCGYYTSHQRTSYVPCVSHTPQRSYGNNLGARTSKSLVFKCFWLVVVCFVWVFLVRIDTLGGSCTFLSLKGAFQRVSLRRTRESPLQPAVLGRSCRCVISFHFGQPLLLSFFKADFLKLVSLMGGFIFLLKEKSV